MISTSGNFESDLDESLQNEQTFEENNFSTENNDECEDNAHNPIALSMSRSQVYSPKT